MDATPEHEDIDFEPEDELGTLGAAKAKMQKLRDELEKVKAERQEYLDGWQRCKADTVNAKKEALSLGEKAGKRALESFVEDLMPALDSFDMAVGSAAWGSIDKNWRAGMEQVRAQLLDALSRHGVERYGAVGDAFDHALYEAAEEDATIEGESGTVARILRFGYKSQDRVLRPAQVIIKS